MSCKKFHEITPTKPKVIGANTLNFKSNLNVHPYNFGVPIPICGAR